MGKRTVRHVERCLEMSEGLCQAVYTQPPLFTSTQPSVYDQTKGLFDQTNLFLNKLNVLL